MNIKSTLLNLISIISYLILSLIWFTWYIFIGEDTHINTIQDYVEFNIFTFICMLVLFLYFKFSKGIIANCIMVIGGIVSLPLIVAGYLGTSKGILPCSGLGYIRLIVLVFHIALYFFGTYKIYRLIKLKFKTS